MEDLPEPPDLNHFPIGRIVADRYEVLSHLGYGGMGLVLKAKDRVLDGEVVVLKILYSQFGSDESMFARFRREVLLSRKLSHPHIVRIYDFGDAGNDMYFISMEYVEGESLAARLKKLGPNGLPIKEVIDYMYQVCEGLSYAHLQGVIHRDIKPANMMVTPDGQIKITDFGVARSLDSTEKLTKTDEAVGSPIYMSPEQINTGTLDHRSDIYAMGIMGYELAVGKPPFYSDHWLMLVRMHLTEPIPQFAGKGSGIPGWYQELIEKAAAKDASKRFQSVEAMGKFILENSSESGEGAALAYTKNQSLSFRAMIAIILACIAAIVTAAFLIIR